MAFQNDQEIVDTDQSRENLIGKTEAKKLSPLGKFQRWRINSPLILVGWRWGLKLGVVLTILILILNLGVTLGIILPRGGPDEDGKVALMNDRCERVKIYNTAYHLAINILSTLLLGSSNYMMQCLSTPTRSEVDAAHAKGTFLDVGISSLKNLQYVSRGKLILWFFLASSSWPLHLL